MSALSVLNMDNLVSPRTMLCCAVSCGVGMLMGAGVSLLINGASTEHYYELGAVKESCRFSGCRARMMIPSKSVGAVIGPKGRVMKKIEADTGATLDFNRDETSEDWDESECADVGANRWLTIRGRDQYSVSSAELAVRRLVNCKEPALRRSFDVPKNAVGMLIGRNGCYINLMREKSGAEINIDKQTDDENVVKVVVDGSPSAFAIVKGLVDSKISAASEKSVHNVQKMLRDDQYNQLQYV